MLPRTLTLVPAMLTLFASTVPAATVYDLTVIAIADGQAGQSPFWTFRFAPGIADTGIVAFNASIDPDKEHGVFTGDGAIVTPIFIGPMFASSIMPSVNSGGMTLFTTSDAGVTCAHAGNGGDIIDYACSRDDPDNLLWFWSQAINDADVGVMIAGVNRNGMYLGDGGTPQLLYDPDDWNEFSLFFSADINDEGVVAACAGDVSNPRFIIRGAGEPPTVIADRDADNIGQIVLQSISINNHGAVAFSTARGLGGPIEHIYVGSGGPLTLVVDNAGPFEDFGGGWTWDLGPSLNDDGLIAFWARLDAGGEGIFTGPDSIADKVVAVGDPLLGSTIRDIAFGHFGLNNLGQIAFVASLADGRQAIVRADPAISCPADLDGDADADADDFFAYLDAFAAGNADVCDIDGDGDCDADDFFGYLDLFAQGC